MRQLSGLFVATILLAGALVAPINFASADNDDYDHDEIEEIEDFDDGVVLFYSSTTKTGLSDKSIKKFGKSKTCQIDTTSISISNLTKKIKSIFKGKFDEDKVDWLSLVSEKNNLKKFFPY